MKKFLAIIAALPLLLAAQSVDVLSTMHSASGRLMEGAEGSWKKSGETVNFTKTNAKGYIIYAASSKFDPPIIPGQLYEATAEFDISGDATAALMISMPGGKRRPFPIDTLKKSGKAILMFTARPDEKHVHFHVVIRGQGEVTLKSMTLTPVDPGKYNQLLAINGSASPKEGAEGSALCRDGKLRVTKTNAAGYILFGSSKNDLPIIPGKDYSVTADLEVSDGASGILMISMPGGKRRPFPQKKLDKNGKAVINFTARPDEKKLRLHIVVRGQGEVICNSITVRELTANSGAVIVTSGDRVAFLGDSITQAGNRFAGYINMVVTGLRANGINITKIPAGVSGNKSNQMLARLESSVLSKKPQIMFLSCGVNDVWHGARGVKLPEYKKNITAIVEKTQAAGVKVIILTATMIREDADNDFNKQLIPYNEFLRQLAKEKNCLLIDLNAAMQQQIAEFKAANQGVSGNILTVDGVHMNALGNAMMAKNILRGFGLNDAQLAIAEKAWGKIRFPLNDRIMITVDEYDRLTAKAAEKGMTVPQFIAELLKNALH